MHPCVTSLFGSFTLLCPHTQMSTFEITRAKIKQGHILFNRTDVSRTTSVDQNLRQQLWFVVTAKTNMSGSILTNLSKKAELSMNVFFPPPPSPSFLPKRFLNSLFAHHFLTRNADGKWFSTVSHYSSVLRCLWLLQFTNQHVFIKYPKLLIIKGKTCKKLTKKIALHRLFAVERSGIG